jgi:iron complex transport system substrate-binding protein
MSRGLALATAAALVTTSVAAAPQPQRVMSLNLCTDQLVLQLVPRDRITSVSFLSRQAAYPYLSAEAAGVPINYGSAEEVLRERPDVVVTGSTTTPTTRTLLKRIGASLIEVQAAENFEQIRMVTRQVARAVGADERAEALIDEMDATLAELARKAPTRRVVVAGWDGAGNVRAKGTLFDSILTAAGGENIAVRLETVSPSGLQASFDLEQLVTMRPDILVYGSSQAESLDLASEPLQHPVVRRLYAGRQIVYPETPYACGLPQSAMAARDLQRAMLDIIAKQRAAP